MKNPESGPPGKKRGRPRRHNRLRRLHRWLGLASLVFVLVLSLTGLGLNHAVQWGWDSRYVDADWLLAWYGFEAPEPGVSFAAGDRRVTLVGNRIYLDANEAARGVDELVAAAALDGLYVAATSESLLYFSGAAELVDRQQPIAGLPGDIEALAVAERGLLLRSRGRVFVADPRTLEASADIADDGAIEWSAASPVPATLERAIAQSYRGPGVSFERLLLDLHNGRLFARAGVWFLDAAAILLVALSVTGLVLWARRRG